MLSKKMIIPVIWDGGISGRLKLLNQRLLPISLKYKYCNSVKDTYTSIKDLVVRGAPAIGVTAAFGMYLSIADLKRFNKKIIGERLKKAETFLNASRPTAVNLMYATQRMRKYTNNLIKNKSKYDISKFKKLILNQAFCIRDEDVQSCINIGKFGASLFKKKVSILTYCNAGSLATAKYGTALSVIYHLAKADKLKDVFVPETRPVLQGARLTAWELIYAGLKPYLICDNMIGSIMSKKKVDAVIVGADRIAKNGDTANKIGTYQLAILAKAHKIPFYVAAPLTTFDKKTISGKNIKIEQRPIDEITHIRGNQIAPNKVNAFNPAFDVTPKIYIKKFITDKGIQTP